MFSEGDMTMRNLLGGRCATLQRRQASDFLVPQGFTITTEACTQYYRGDGRKINDDEIQAQVMEGVKEDGGDQRQRSSGICRIQSYWYQVRSGANSCRGMMDIKYLNLDFK